MLETVNFKRVVAYGVDQMLDITSHIPFNDSLEDIRADAEFQMQYLSTTDNKTHVRFTNVSQIPIHLLTEELQHLLVSRQ